MGLQSMQQPRRWATQQTPGTSSDQLLPLQKPPHLRQSHNQKAAQVATAAVAAIAAALTPLLSPPAGRQPVFILVSLQPDQRRQRQLTPGIQLERQEQRNLLLGGRRRQVQRTSLLRRWPSLGTLELPTWSPQQPRASRSKALAAAMTAVMAAAVTATVVTPKLVMALKMWRRSEHEWTFSSSMRSIMGLACCSAAHGIPVVSQRQNSSPSAIVRSTVAPSQRQRGLSPSHKLPYNLETPVHPLPKRSSVLTR